MLARAFLACTSRTGASGRAAARLRRFGRKIITPLTLGRTHPADCQKKPAICCIRLPGSTEVTDKNMISMFGTGVET